MQREASLNRKAAVTATLLLTLAALVLWQGASQGRQQAAVPPANVRPDSTLRVVVADEPETLDPHQSVRGITNSILCWVGASLVALDPEGEIVPYLAERWTTSEDALTWTFYLKPGILFHDGTPLTADAYAYAFRRAMDPETATGASPALLGPVRAVEARDPLTLQLTLSDPFFPLLINLTACGFLMPLSQAWVEAHGGEIARHPMSVGPYRFVEWRSGERLRLERNEQFAWGPAWAAQEPFSLPAIEFRFLPDAATRLAALEANEADVGEISPRDIPAIERSGRFEVLSAPVAGAAPIALFNVSQPPFDDVRVRRAFNLAVNRPALINAVVQGHAEPQLGPISRSVVGYWPGVEAQGYAYEPEQARALLAEAGYRPGPDGTLEREGAPLRLTLLATAEFEKDAEVLQQQFGELGADITIELLDNAILAARLFAGEYRITLAGVAFPDADILYLLFHSTGAALPISQLDDPELDLLLERTRSTVDARQRQQWVNQAQAYLVEQAYSLPLYTPLRFTAVSKQLSGLRMAPNGELLYNQTTLTAP